MVEELTLASGNEAMTVEAGRKRLYLVMIGVSSALKQWSKRLQVKFGHGRQNFTASTSELLPPKK